MTIQIVHLSATSTKRNYQMKKQKVKVEEPDINTNRALKVYHYRIGYYKCSRDVFIPGLNTYWTLFGRKLIGRWRP